MERNELNFIGSDPGAVTYGNFINYYSFHSAKQRIRNLHTKMFPVPIANQPYLCLDIGCNTGELTVELYKYLYTLYPNINIHILAIDIDSSLVGRAKESIDHENITFVAANIMAESDQKHIDNFLAQFQAKNFNLIFCFSVTMWLHINNGDEGLINFLNYILNITKCLILEPQPWNCYRNAQRRLKKSGSTFPLYNMLKLRSNVQLFIENKILENGYSKVYESPNSSWDRKIQSFQISGLDISNNPEPNL